MKKNKSLIIKFCFISIPCFLFLQLANASHNQLIAKDSVAGVKSVTITGVGDIMLGSSFPDNRSLPPKNNPFLLLESAADILKSSDVTFGNLEGSFLNGGEPVKKCKDSTICYLFRMPERYISALTYSGFDVLSLANNHFGDFGYPSRVKTIKLLDSAGIFYGGLTEHPYSIFTRDSVVYGFCAFSPLIGTINMNDVEGARRIVKMLNDKCDIVIVSFHGGAEGAEYQKVPKKKEFFYGEDRGDVYQFAHDMIDCGADVVFGHGPHVTRAIEVYKNRFISYSLGNFCTYGRFNLSGPNGIAPIVKLKLDAKGKFVSGNIFSVYQTWPGGVKIDPQGRVIKKLQDLTASDFPDNPIKISNEGEITYK
jgi:poly-gamma-glutamate capsule biosynthesis protein CapA/YwtB (metallophosphatase superfamily)